MQENVLTFNIDNVAGGEFYVDIAEAMSIVNRKLHRQQGLWKVDAVCVWVSNAGQLTGMPYSIAIGGAPRTWVTRNALVKTFEHWKDQQQLARKATGSDIRPTWEDFKVRLNESHRTTGSLVPVSGHMFGGDDTYIAGEWAQSKMVIESVDGAGAVVQTEPVFHILGPDNVGTSVGLITQYAKSRALVQSPDPDTGLVDPDNIFAAGSVALDAQVEELIENMKADNDEPPYDQPSYPGGGSNGIEPILYAFGANTNVLGRKMVLNGFAAPNGLLEIQIDSSLESNMDIWMQFFVSGREAY